jgi:hypothetical protein
MDISLDRGDLYYTTVTKDDDAILWHDSQAVNVRFAMTFPERLSFLIEWLEAEDDREAGRYLEILRYLANEKGWTVEERDPGPEIGFVCVEEGAPGKHAPIYADTHGNYSQPDVAPINSFSEPQIKASTAEARAMMDELTGGGQ